MNKNIILPLAGISKDKIKWVSVYVIQEQLLSEYKYEGRGKIVRGFGEELKKENHKKPEGDRTGIEREK